jgi:hypothetical protein
MTNRFLFFAAATLLAALNTAQAAPIGPAHSVVPLFTGQDLSGWHPWLVDTKREDPRRVFTVTNDLIRISGEGLGYLSTEQEFENFRLVLEFKWGATNWPWGGRVGKARDSGIFLHSTGPEGNSHDGQGAFKAAIECNLFQGATGDLLLIRGNAADGSLIAPRLTAEIGPERDAENWPYWRKGGRRETIQGWGRLNWSNKDSHWKDQFDYRGAREVEKPPGDWNQVECICDGGHVIVKLNGTIVNEAFDVFPARGKILLQCEGSEIFFRRLELYPLTPTRLAGVDSGTAGRRMTLTDGVLFVPDGFQANDSGIDLLIHLHGAAGTVERNHQLARYPGVLVTTTLPGLSGVYSKRFSDTNVFARILAETGAHLKESGAAPKPRVGRVTVQFVQRRLWRCARTAQRPGGVRAD